METEGFEGFTELRMVIATRCAERAATDREDIRVILKSTKVNLKALRDKARDESTSRILEDLIRA